MLAARRRLLLLILLILGLIAAWLRRRFALGRRITTSSAEQLQAKATETAIDAGARSPAVNIETVVEANGQQPPSQPRRGSVTRELRKGNGFAAFLSHYKIEAATEARWLQENLEVALDRQLFLDSDDLLDLTRLKDHVRESECILLLQTRSVLTRPWCIVELLTAIDAGVPIIGVSILSGAFTYDFAAASTFMTHIDTQLDAEKRAQISALGIDLASAAFKLSNVLPNIISLPLNMNESRAILDARIGEIIGAMGKARLPAITAQMDTWLKARGEAPAPLLHGFASGGAPSSAGPAGAIAAGDHPKARPPVAASIPPEVPELPPAVQARPALLGALKQAVLERPGATAAMGMGGVGKSCLASQLVRDPEVGVAFDRLLWCSVSQTPDVLKLLRDLHFQLLSKKMDATVDEERYAVQLVREAAKGMHVLCVLDDVWEKHHAELLNCVDVSAGSSCVITTRIRNLAEAEVSCGLLTEDEALSLLLISAGLPNLIKTPPKAAYEAVECCGRLALALPIAGSMIRVMGDTWQEELVPMLREELSDELSVEQRIVQASLRSCEPSQRAGVEALFLCFGVFAEDDVVPTAVLDALSPLVYSHAGGVAVSASKMKARRWLTWLLDASLLSGSLEKGLSVHDLVRDVMLTRAAAAEGGLNQLQREVVRLLVDAFDAQETKAASEYVANRLSWHVKQAAKAEAAKAEAKAAAMEHQQASIPSDPLLMKVLTHESGDVRRQGAVGLGAATLSASADACDERGEHYEAAQLIFASCSLKGMAAGGEALRAWASLRRLSAEEKETSASRTLEMKVLAILSMSSTDDCDSENNAEVLERMAQLGSTLGSDGDGDGGGGDGGGGGGSGGGGGGGAAKKGTEAVHAEISLIIVEAMKAWAYEGLRGDAREEHHAVITAETLEQSHTHLMQCMVHADNGAAAAADEPTRHAMLMHGVFFATEYPRKMTLSSSASDSRRGAFYDWDRCFGVNGASLYALNDSYDFNTHHQIAKTLGFQMDIFMTGCSLLAILLRYGDLNAVRRYLAKYRAAWEAVDKKVASGEVGTAPFTYEIWLSTHLLPLVATWAGELDTVRWFRQLSVVESLVTDEAAKEGVSGFWKQWGGWEHEGHIHSTQASWTLILKAMAAMFEAEDEEEEGTETKGRKAKDDEALRAWLPPLSELLRIAEYHDAYRTHGYGSLHPSLICATLHGERLGDWSVAVSVAARLEELEPFNPFLRTEAQRLLCKAHSKLGERDAACAAAERAAEDAASAGCHWLEMLALRDLLKCRRFHLDKTNKNGDAAHPKNEVEEGEEDVGEAAIWRRLVECKGRLLATPEELTPIMGEDLKSEWEGLFQ